MKCSEVFLSNLHFPIVQWYLSQALYVKSIL
jgi:hypothetical protein